MRQRVKKRTGELTDEQIRRLDEIGIVWETDDKWMNKAYFESNGNLDISATYITEDGIKLSTWLTNQRYQYRNSKLKRERFDSLNELNIIW